MKKRIQKVLSEQGVCSRRAAEKLIEEGKIQVNGKTATLGDGVDPDRDSLTIDGSRVEMKRTVRHVYYLLNKPRGYVTTLKDEHAGRMITELLGDIGERVYPVGRLDKDSEGLLLLTNDGELANLIAHPSSKLTKVYRVSVKPSPTEEQLIALSEGVVLDDGYRTRPMKVRHLEDSGERGLLEFVLSEGHNRQIRRMCEAVGLTVSRLNRISIGPLRLQGLAAGKVRALTKEEIAAIRGACMKKPHTGR